MNATIWHKPDWVQNAPGGPSSVFHLMLSRARVTRSLCGMVKPLRDRRIGLNPFPGWIRSVHTIGKPMCKRCSSEASRMKLEINTS